MNFNRIQLQDVCNVKGRIGWKGYKKTDLKDSGPIVIGGNNIKNRLYNDYSEIKHLSMDKFIESPEIILKKDEIIVVSRGNGCGDVGYYHGEYKEATINPSVVILSDITCNPQYLFYYLVSKVGQERLRSLISGSSIPAIYQASLRSIQVDVLPIKNQIFIANILSSLDDKIELNNKINKNLEELAQTLYKRWFVDFEFPNEDGEPYKSSGGEMVESELGLIPKGWEVESIGESSISKLISSGIKEFNGTKKYIATADVTNLSITSFVTEIDFKKRPSRANMQPIAGSLWFAKMKDSRKMIRISKSSRYLIDKCILSTGFAGLFAPKYSNYIWTILTTKDFDDTKNNLCNGTTMQAINNENINRIRILIPDTKTLDLFESVSEPIFEKIQFNEIESNKLSKIRDELLPKLMSGEIEVPIEE